MPRAQTPRRLEWAAVTTGLPAVASIVLAVVVTGLQVINQAVLTDNPQWQAVIAVVLIFAAGEGIRPLTPPGLTVLIHVPVWLATLLTSISAGLLGVLQIVHMTAFAHTIVAAVVTFLVSLGFGGSAEPHPPANNATTGTIAR